MRISVSAGHSRAYPGASGYMDEVTEARKVRDALVKELKARGHTVIDCTGTDKKGVRPLTSEIAKVNKANVEKALSIHLNAGGGTGSEVWYDARSSKGKALAQKIAPKLAGALGLRNRGAKPDTQYSAGRLGFCRDTEPVAVILEVAFVDSKKDKEALRAAGYAKVASAVADAVVGAAKPAGKTLLQCAETGYWGTKITRLLQALNGIEESGIVYRQPKSAKKFLKAMTSSKFTNHSFRFVKDSEVGEGSLAIKRLQSRKLGIPWKDCTGVFDAKTRRLFIERYCPNPEQTSTLCAPSTAVRNFAKEINEEARKKGIKR